MHVLPVLGALEERRRGDPVVAIGVHSAKFDAENAPDRIRDAMARYGVRHPVVVDRGHEVWSRYAIRSWPTVVVIRPDGTIAAMAAGECDLGPLDAFVVRLLEEARADGTLARSPFRVDSPPREAPGELAFPGKVIALARGRLAVSDSGHHRVLILDIEGRVDRVIGSGTAGLSDGALEQARFVHPQGLAFDPDRELLFVADTSNHVLREVDLPRGRVRTVAGTAELGRGVPRGASPARDVALRSPWDLALAGDYLLVAMAGAHQIWAYHREDETVAVLAGSGRESIEDGPFPTAACAQPSGLALAGPRLYLADSETSAVRYLDLGKGEVRTLVGTGLFDFGDRDGPAAEALLQHPMGIAHGPAGLLVADSYNDKIRRVDEETGEVRTVFAGDGEVRLREPAGLCQLEDGRVVVADTNQHRLVLLSADGLAAHVLPVRGAAEGAPVAGTALRAAGPPLQILEPATLGLGGVTLRLRLDPPSGLELASGSRVSILVTSAPPVTSPSGDQGFEVARDRRSVPILLTSGPEAGETAVEVGVEAVLCSHGDAAACWPVRGTYRLPLRVVPEDAGGAVRATLALPDPR